MATKKSKSSNKSNKAKSTKPKTAAKTAAKSELEAPKSKATETTKKVVESTAETKSKSTNHEESASSGKKESCIRSFFAKKYEGKESILTIFKSRKFYGALLGEVIGTMLLALLFFSIMLMNMPSAATYSFAIIAVLVAVYAFSGTCLNPLIAVGMMASRRMSVIRGIMYIIAEVIGAWLGWIIFNGFHLAGGETAYAVPTMSAIAEGNFWIVALIELMGAAIIGFFFARALKYKRSVFTFGAVVAGGIVLAIVVCYVISAAFFSLNNNFILNPAIASMLEIFPQSGDNFGEVIGGICQALSAYALLPMAGGVVGFYLSDLIGKLSEEE